MAFVQYLSGYAVEPADQRNRRIPLVRFESRLYKDIYQEQLVKKKPGAWRGFAD